MSSNKNPPRAARLSAIVTRTTARIQGVQDYRIDAHWAHTPEAAVTLTWGHMLLHFTSANAAQGVLEGFAAAQGHMREVDRSAPSAPALTGDYAVPVIRLAWARRTPYAAVHRNAYSEIQRRVLHWVELNMGPMTWQIIDQQGYSSAMAILRQTHRTAVEVCLDGRWHQQDPTKDNYRAPDPVLEDYRNHLAAEHYSPQTSMRWDGSVPANGSPSTDDAIEATNGAGLDFGS